jgi:hypothetical protein
VKKFSGSKTKQVVKHCYEGDDMQRRHATTTARTTVRMKGVYFLSNIRSRACTGIDSTHLSNHGDSKLCCCECSLSAPRTGTARARTRTYVHAPAIVHEPAITCPPMHPHELTCGTVLLCTPVITQGGIRKHSGGN